MGTKYILCLVCFEKSRRRKGWWCPHCEHMKPPEPRPEQVIPIPPQPVVYEKPKPIKSKPKQISPNLERRLEREQLAKDIARIDRSKLPKLNLRPKAGLRRT